jgi:hypothetical protein
MQRTRVALLVVLFGAATSAAAGDVWIDCEPGLDIFLDGESVGVSGPKKQGMLLRGIESGDHAIRIEKDGFSPVELSVNVGFAANQIVIDDFGPEIAAAPPAPSEGEVETELAGTIEITSEPSECNVKLGDLRIQKQHPILTIAGVPVGEHKMWFESSATVFSEKVAVLAAQSTRVQVDFHNQRASITVVTSDVGADDSEEAGEGPRAGPGCIEYWVQVLRTGHVELIEPSQAALKAQGFPLYHQQLIVLEDDGAIPVYKLRVGPIDRENKAKHVAGLLRHGGFTTAWVAREECQ